MATTTSVLDVLVIGAGQAGLALGYQLKQTGQAFMLVDKYDRIGESWRRRFDSLTLFTPRSYSALPGLSVAGDPDGYPNGPLPVIDPAAALAWLIGRHG